MSDSLDIRARSVIAEVAELPGSQRDAEIARLCGGDAALRDRVVALLQAMEREDGFLSDPTLGGLRDAGGSAAVRERVGGRIGPYRLLELIGEGGFGSVFMAEQTEPVHRRVALKIIKLGMDTRAVVARFEAERQALALMDHAHIARVFDAGATDTGRPYFVMELVKGTPITAFCDEHGLTIPQRLELFNQVCLAVQHAHTKGVIHRDIKPGNILVSEQDGRPQVKIIDFGIAKATQRPLTDKTVFTEFRQLIGTPEYMSPEQAAGSLDIDTRTDVYSLGVLLYEMLAGVTPLDGQRLRSAAFGEMQRIIREVDPPAPSTRLNQSQQTLASIAAQRRTEPRRLGSIIRGELDWIVMRALEKDRARRYDTPGNLASDIERYLDGRPVDAAPPSTAYRLRKFARRNRGVVVAATLVGAALVVGMIGTSAGLVAARRARDAADRHAAESAANAERATKEAARADSEARIAQERQRAAEYESYVANIVAAQSALGLNDAPRLHARLAACPEELRGWEWRYLSAASDNSDRVMVVPGPRQDFRMAAFSPDGTQVLTASTDRTARVWNAQTGQEEGRLRGHSAAVNIATCSPDGARILTCAHDSTARIWDRRSFRDLLVLVGHEGPVADGCFDHRGRRVVTASHDGTARIWDAASGRCEAVLRGHAKMVVRACFSPDDARVLTASHDGTARVFDAGTGAEVLVLRGHERAVSSARYSPDGRWIVTGSEDRTARTWDARTGAPGVVYRGHTQHVHHAQFTPDSSRVMTADWGPIARVWEASTGRDVATLVGHTHAVQGAAMSPDGEQIVTRSIDSTVRLWETRTGRALAVFRGHTDIPWAAEFSPDGRSVVSAGERTIRIWSTLPREDLPRIIEPSGDSYGLVLSADGSHALELAAGGRGFGVRLIDLKSGTHRWEFDAVEYDGGAMSFSPDGARFVCVPEQPTLEVRETADGRTISRLIGHGAPTYDATFSPDGRLVASGSEDTMVRLWDAETGEMVRLLAGHSGAVDAVAFDPSGRRLVSGSADKTGIVWDSATGERVATLEGHFNRITSVCFSPDGSRVLTTSVEYTARVWDAASGKDLLVLRGHGNSVFWGAFSPDGTRIVTASHDGTARMWDAASGRELLVLAPGGGTVRTVSFSADGTRLMLGLSDGRIDTHDTVPLRERGAGAVQRRSNR